MNNTPGLRRLPRPGPEVFSILAIPHFLVESVFFYQFCMRAILYNNAIFYNKNFITVFCHRKPMRYDDTSQIFAFFEQIHSNFFFCNRIQMTRCLIQYQNLRFSQRNITQEKLAEQVGISVVYLSKIENGRVYPTLETLSNICTELDTELAEILTNTEIARKDYANDRVVELFNSCSMRVKPIALALLEDLSKL